MAELVHNFTAMLNMPTTRQTLRAQNAERKRNHASRENLTRAFLTFTQAAGSLEHSYTQLQAEVSRLHQELQRTNYELERSLEENARTRAYLSRVVESLPCGVLVISPQAKVQIINPEARRLLHFQPIGSPENEAQFPAEFQKLLSQPVQDNFFCEQEWPSSESFGNRYIGILRANVNDNSDVPGDTIWIIRDITEEKRIATDREAARRSLALAEVATILAHEIRNPLGSMELFTGLLADATAHLPETRQWVTHLQAGLRALSATSNNIANVNTPGYSRQRANLAETPAVQIGNLTFGTGVTISDVTSLRDSILDLRVNQETQQQGQLTAFITSGQQIQTVFNETNGTGLQAPLTAFFNSLSQLATNPSDANARQGVLTAAQNLASAFNQSANHLTTLQRNTDLSVKQSVTEINSLTAQIATVNAQVSAASGAGQNAGPFIDQRQQLLNQLSGLVDLSEIDAGNGSITLTTTSGAPLVVGNQSFALTTSGDATTGLQHVFSQGTDITSKITSGALAGQLQIRDQEIPSTLTSLDTLVASLATAVNTQNQAGFDLNGAAGGNLFVPPPIGGAGAAASLAVAITDPTKIAASGGPAPGSPGDNTNANALLALQNQAFVGGQTPLNYYSGFVFKIGNDVSSAQTNQQSGSLVLQQIQNLQGGVSGVDINEEAANLIRFQNAYQASAQVTSIINTLLETTINMVQ